MAGTWDEVDAELEQQQKQDAQPAPGAGGAPPAQFKSAWDAVDYVTQAEDRSKVARIRRIFEEGLRGTPDDRATVWEVNRLTGLKPELIESQLPLLKQRAQAAAFDADRFVKDSPGLVDLLLSDPRGADVVLHDAPSHRIFDAISGGYKALMGAGTGEGSLVSDPEEALADPELLKRRQELLQKTLHFGSEPGDEAALAEVKQLEGQIKESIKAAKAALPPPSEQRQVAMRESETSRLTGVSRVTGAWDFKPGAEVGSTPLPEGAHTIDTGLGLLVQRAPGVQQAQFESKLKGNEYGMLGARIVAAKFRAGRGDPGAADEVWALEKQAMEMAPEMIPLYLGAGPIEQLTVDAADVLGSNAPMLTRGAEAGTIAAGITYAAVRGATKNPALAKKVAGEAFKKAGAAVAFLTSFELELGSAYLQAKGQRTARGEYVDDDLNVGASVAYALVAAAVETDALGDTLGMWGPLAGVVKKGGFAAARGKMLKDATFRAALKRAGKAWLKGGYAEGREEVIQQIAQDVAQFGARLWKTADRGPDAAMEEIRAADPGETMAQAWEAFWTAARGTWTLGATSPLGVSAILGERARREASLRNGQVVAQIAQLPATDSARAAPAVTARRLIEETSRSGEPVTALHVAGAALQEVIQAAPDPERAAVELLGEDGPARLAAAVAGANGGRVEVPLETYLSKWGTSLLEGEEEGAGATVAERLALDTALRPGLSTVREEGLAAEQKARRVQELRAAYLAEDAAQPASQSERYLVDAVEGQLSRTGVYDEKKSRDAVAGIRALLRAQAEAAGAQPDDVFDGYVLTVDVETADQEAQRLRDEAAAAQDEVRQGEGAAPAQRLSQGPLRLIQGEGKGAMEPSFENARRIIAWSHGQDLNSSASEQPGVHPAWRTSDADHRATVRRSFDHYARGGSYAGWDLLRIAKDVISREAEQAGSEIERARLTKLAASFQEAQQREVERLHLKHGSPADTAAGDGGEVQGQIVLPPMDPAEAASMGPGSRRLFQSKKVGPDQGDDPIGHAETALAAARQRLEAAMAARAQANSDYLRQWGADDGGDKPGAPGLEKDPARRAAEAAAKAAKAEVARWEKRLKAAGGPRNLVVIHNLTAGNLLHALELGGLPAPSIAITKAEHPADGFGEITLIGGPDLIDPKTGVPVFNADVYSPRWPTTRWKVDGKKAQKLAQRLRPFADLVNDYVSDLENEIGKEGPEGQAERLRDTFAAAWLAEQGRPVEPVTRPARLDRDWSSTPALTSFFAEHGDKTMSFEDGDEYHRALSAAASAAIDEWAAKIVAATGWDQEDAADLRDVQRKATFGDDGLILAGVAGALSRDSRKVGANEVDKQATAERVRTAAQPHAAEIQAWALPQIQAVTTGRYIAKWTDTQDGGKWRHIPYTLENILKEMTRVVRAGEEGSFGGLARARSKGALKFKTIEAIQKARDSIVTSEEFREAKEAIDARWNEIEEEIRPHYRGERYRLNDNLADAIGESYRRGHWLSKELELSTFEGVPAELVAKIAAFSRDLVALPTEYFEAKPQRVVDLSEFQAAVVPDDAAPETLTALGKLGLPLFKYERGNEESRQQATEAAARDRKVLFQRAKHGSHVRDIERFSLDFMGTGEGHQAFGWGLYFAQAKHTAETYREHNSRKHGIAPRAQWDFLPADVDDPVKFMMSLSTPEKIAWADLHGSVGWYKAESKDAGERTVQLYRDIVASQTEQADRAERDDAAIRKEIAEEGETPERTALLVRIAERHRKALESIKEKQAALDLIEKHGLVAKPPVAAGQLYEVEIPEDHLLLDYDAPLDRQPAGVLEALTANGIIFKSTSIDGLWFVRDPYGRSENDTGVDSGFGLYRAMERLLRSDRAASEALRKVGIPGLRFLDGESRDDWRIGWAAPRSEPFAAEVLDQIVRQANATTRAGKDFGRQIAFQLKEAREFGDIRVDTAAQTLKKARAKVAAAEDGWDARDIAEAEAALATAQERLAFVNGLKPEDFKDLATRNFVVWDDKTIEVVGTFYQKAWHGSPFKFHRFELVHLGKGEGAQAYGWGMYFAQDRGIAEHYRSTLSARSLDDLADSWGSYPAPAEGTIAARLSERFDGDGSRFTDGKGENIEEVAQGIGAIKKKIRGELTVYSFRDGTALVVGAGAWDVTAPPGGGLYQVDLPENAELLDYDADLDQQPAGIVAKLEAAGIIKRVMDRGSLGSVHLPNGEHVPYERCRGVTVYNALAEGLRDPARASQALDKAGIPGLRYLDGNSRWDGEGSHNFVIWNEDRVSIMESYLQRKRTLTPEQQKRLEEVEGRLRAAVAKRSNELRAAGDAFPDEHAQDEIMGRGVPAEQGAADLKAEWLVLKGYGAKAAEKLATRGYVDMMRDGLKRVFNVVFTKNADLSTFLHESGHVFLEIMGDLAERPGANARITADWTATLDWLGVKSRHEIETEHHEKWARAFEAYLMEGKAPSAALVESFQRFKRWLKGVYRAAPPEQLDEKIRGIFDRLLATDQEIEAMKAAAGMDKPLLSSPEDLGGDARAWQAYLDDREASFQTASVRADKMAVKAALKVLEEWWKEEQKKLTAEAAGEWNELPGARAWAFLKKGATGGDPALQGLLDLARSEAGEKVKPKLSKAQQDRLTEIATALAALEGERKVSRAVEDLLRADPALTAEAAETAARRQVEKETEDPFKVRSALRTVYFLAEKDEEGRVSLVAPWTGESMEGQEVRSLELPTWLSAEEYLSDPAAWTRAWSALTTTGSKFAGQRTQRLVESGEVHADGVTASESAQRAIFDYMHAGLAAFPEPDRQMLMKGWALGRLLSASYNPRIGGGFSADMRAQTARWIIQGKDAPGRFPEPLSPRQFEILLRNTAPALKREAEARAGGTAAGRALKSGEVAVAQEERKPSQASEEIAAQQAKLREEQEKILGLAVDQAVAGVRVKLDYEGLVRAVGKDVAAERFRGLTALEGGATPEELAQILGFSSGKDLLDGMLDLPDRDEWAEAQAKDRMEARHPDEALERERLRLEAARALHNKGTQDWLLRELVALRARAGQAGMPPVEAIREAADQIAEDRRADDTASGRALQAERKHAEEALRLATRGDFKAAYVAQQKRLLNHYLFSALEKAKDDVEKLEEVAGKLGSSKARGQLGLGSKTFLDASDTILEALGFKERPTDPAALLERKTLPEWTKALEEQGIAPAFEIQRLAAIVTSPPDAGSTRTYQRKGQTVGGRKLPAWRALSVKDVRVVLNALLQLRAAARDVNSVMDLGKRVAIAELVGKMGVEASGLPLLPDRPGSDTQLSPGRRASLRLQGWDAALVDPEQMFRDLGPSAYRFFFQRYLEQRQVEDELSEAVLKHLEAAWEKLPEGLAQARYDLLAAEQLEDVPLPPDVRRDGAQRDRQWMWMVALNMGNRSNMERLVGGYAWEEAKVRTFLDRNMSAKEWDFIESIWALLDEKLYPQVAAAYEKTNGVKPDKIPALPFQLSTGRIIKGGYFPARYDAVASRVGETQREEALTKLYASKAGAMSVARSFTKERVKKYEDVINLQWGEVPRHVAQVVHYVAFDGFVRDAGRVMADGQFKAVVERRLGERFYPQMEQWLRTVASAQADAVPEALADVQFLLGEIRSRFVMQTLGYSLTVAAGDLSNPLVAIASGKVKARHGLPALAWGLRALIDMATDQDEPARLSFELRHRRTSFTRKLKHELAQIGVSGARRGLHQKIRDTAWVFMEFTDRITSTVIWKGAYDQARAAGKTEAEAVLEADAIVRGQLPSHDLAEQPAFLRDKRGVGAITAFYGYFSKVYNINREIWRPSTLAWMEEGGSKAKAAGMTAHAAGRTLAVIFATNVLAEILSGRGPDDDEGWGEWFARKMLAAPFTWLPLVGPAGEFAVNSLVSKIVHGKSKERSFSARASPGMAGIQRLVQSVGDALDGTQDGEDRVMGVLAAYGFLTNTPIGSNQMRRTFEYVGSGQAYRDAARGRVMEIPRGLVYGERRKKKAAGRTGQPQRPKR